MSRRDCEALLADQGWPKAPRTSCYLCPNQTLGEWSDMAANEPGEFERACLAEADLHRSHPDVFLHSACRPLADAVQGKPSGIAGSIVLSALRDRHKPASDVAFVVAETRFASCRETGCFRGGRCPRFAGCQAFDRYVEELLSGDCPRWAGLPLADGDTEEWSCDR